MMTDIQQHEQLDTTAWYRQFWPWFLIALPGSVVIASIITIVIAVKNPDSVIVDDYYKKGLAINQDLSRDQYAIDHNIRATLQLGGAGTKIRILMSAEQTIKSETLSLHIMHPTLSEQDRHVELKKLHDGTYIGDINKPAAGNWDVTLEAKNPAWRIQKRVTFSGSQGSYVLR